MKRSEYNIFEVILWHIQKENCLLELYNVKQVEKVCEQRDDPFVHKNKKWLQRTTFKVFYNAGTNIKDIALLSYNFIIIYNMHICQILFTLF